MLRDDATEYGNVTMMFDCCRRAVRIGGCLQGAQIDIEVGPKDRGTERDIGMQYVSRMFPKDFNT